ncbi:hypothetical protein [uncultured Sphingomonas sp.]|uniref:hypothetical protein n=1 Tax=uncultured Sphingomonas sp. TaxID=158754 RepID=UPI0035C9BFA8
MIAALLLTLATTQAGIASPPLPSDWAVLPPLRYDRRPDPPAGLDEFVRGEVSAGRCVLAHGATTLRVDLVVLVDGGVAVRVVPRAIGCATVEQFAAGLLSRLARDHLDPASADGWYRTTLSIAWAGPNHG